MNIWGKVLAFLIILLGGGAFVLTTQLLDFRNSWVKQYETNKKRLIEVKATTQAKRKELAELEANYELLMLSWDKIHENKQAAVLAPDTVQIAIGPSDIMEGKDKEGKAVMPVIHAFKPDAAGKYVYVGEFRAEKLAVGNSTFKATISLPDDANYIQAGANWRIRTRVPVSDEQTFVDFSRRFLILQESTIAKTNELKILTDDVAPKIAMNLANRENQVKGNVALEAQRGKLPNVLIDGQLPTLAAMEESRNALIAEADDLRHRLHTAVTEFERLQSENGRAANDFLKGTTPPAPAVSKR
ncbi:MAG: hypothetical protein JWM11_3580 [Planctomycetaceae bacterium]|nr:hypothetical protein [Planctomycetaceae bacterium]